MFVTSRLFRALVQEKWIGAYVKQNGHFYGVLVQVNTTVRTWLTARSPVTVGGMCGNVCVGLTSTSGASESRTCLRTRLLSVRPFIVKLCVDVVHVRM